MGDSALIAFLPENGAWCKTDFPHMTLVYGGPIADLQESDLNAMAKDAISAARVTGPFSLPVTEVKTLGEGDDAMDALILYPTPQLLLARNIVKHWNKSEFTEFVPHASVGPPGSAFTDKVAYVDDGALADDYQSFDRNIRKDSLPDRLYFNRIAICWGDQKLVFNTNSF